MAQSSNLRVIEATWVGDLKFSGGAPGAPSITIDGDNTTAPGPMQTLLIAAAGCTGSDIVSILKKMQVTLERCDVTVTGERASDYPRRYLKIHFAWKMAGAGLDQIKARRAVDLSISKYCSVLASLAPDITVTHAVRLG